MDDLFSYLIATDQVDEFLGLKKEDEENEEYEDIEYDDKNSDSDSTCSEFSNS